MNNCLVTKLNGVVNNPNLDYFDALQVKINWNLWGGGGSFPLRSSAGYQFGGTGCLVKVLSNGHIGVNETNYGTEYTLNTSSRAYVYPEDSTKTTEFLLFGLSKVEQLWCDYSGGITMKRPEEMKYVQSSALKSGTKGLIIAPYPDFSPLSLSYLKECMDVTAITDFRMVGVDSESYFVSDTSDWSPFINLTVIGSTLNIVSGSTSNLTGLTKIQGIDLKKPGIFGNITDLGNMKELTELNVNSSQIVGDLVDFVALQCSGANPRTSGSLHIYCNSGGSTNIKLNGTPVSAGSGKTLSWTGPNPEDITLS